MLSLMAAATATSGSVSRAAIARTRDCVAFLLLVGYLFPSIGCCAPLCAFCLAVGCPVFVIVRVFSGG